MPETAEVIEEKKPVIASIGKVERVNSFNAPAKQPEAQTTETPAAETEIPAATTETPTATTEPTEETPISKPLSEYTAEEIAEQYKKLHPDTIELTDEQKVQKEKEKDEKRLALYLKGGGTVEQYVTIKQVMDMDLTELSKSELTRELKAKGFDESEIAEVQKERYYQLNPDELQQEDYEEDEAFEARKAKLKKKVDFGSEKLNNRSNHLKNNAKTILDNLDKALEAEDLQRQADIKFIAKIDEVSKTMPRKLNIPLGKLNNEDLGTVDIDVQETSISEIAEQLKDPSQRNKILYTEEGEPNVDRLSQLLLKEKLFDSGAREAFLSGRNDQIAKFEKIFPYKNPTSLGVGGGANPNMAGKSNGKVASFGKAQPIGKPSGK